MKKIKIVLLFLFAWVNTWVYGQEFLAPLQSNEALFDYKDQTQRSSRSDDNYSYLFKFDTNHLPIIDDFSKHYFKSYEFDTVNNPSVTYVWQNFLVDGVYYEGTFEAMLDTSYIYTLVDSVNGIWDSVASPVVYITNLSQVDYQVPIDTDTVWARQDTLVVGNTIITNHFADVEYINFSDTVVHVADEGFSIWKNQNAVHNYTYSNNPPTLGMVTFDGLDSTGVPYDPTMNPNTHQVADVLESKPIFLKTKPDGTTYDYLTDSIYLTFQYQPQGLGDAPEPEDSLVLEFYSPFTDKWNHIWSVSGDTIQPFQQVLIQIQNPIYFLDGFKFRFYNYASVSGNFDHWNIDYVRMYEKSSTHGEIIQDVGLLDPGYSLLENYYQMPWAHYKATTDDVMKTEQFIRYKNQGDLSYTAISTFAVRDSGNILFTGSAGIDPQFGPFATGGQNSYFNDSYPKASPDSVRTFEVRYLAEVNPDNNHDNDTAFFNQQFGTQYAYDDGSAEAAYYLKSPGAQVAIEYDIAVRDSLRALNIYFPRSYTSILDRPFRIMVWKSINPEVVLYESYLHNPVYSGGRDLVQRFELEEPIEVESQIFVGIKQHNDVVYVGMDKNMDSSNRNYYKVQGSWYSSSFPGSLMIRPEFGFNTLQFPVSTEDEVIDETENFRMYPNPANAMVTIQANSSSNQIIVRSMMGVIVRNYSAGYSSTFDTSDLPTGLYLVEQLDVNTQKSTIKKLLIQH